MTLPARIPKPAKSRYRWRSTAHRDFIRSFACCVCGSRQNREVAHVRLNSGAGVGQKPDDWCTVSLCAGPNSNAQNQLGCHNRQHIIGEQTFWKQYEQAHGQTVEQLIAEFIKASPKRREIEDAMRERKLSDG